MAWRNLQCRGIVAQQRGGSDFNVPIQGSKHGEGAVAGYLLTPSYWDAMLPLRAFSAASHADSIHPRIFKDGRTFVAQALELDVSSCGGTKEKALANLKDAVRLFLDEAGKMGTLEQILEEAGCSRIKQKVASPRIQFATRTAR